MRITINVNSAQDIEAAISALRHFLSNKKPDDGRANDWGIGMKGGPYFIVGVKQSGNYTVKQGKD